MKNYKLGNHFDCIIRAYSAGIVGNQVAKYDNQPYTILKNIEANFVFDSIESKSKSSFSNLLYNKDTLSSVSFSNVELNDKILGLIFSKNENKLCHIAQNCEADQNNIYISAPTTEIYNVFVFDINGDLEQSHQLVQANEVGIIVLPVKLNENYLVCFDYEGDLSFSLHKNNNAYFTLDLIVTGNTDDITSKAYIHINKCALSINKNMYFGSEINTVDLKFQVIDDQLSYITLE